MRTQLSLPVQFGGLGIGDNVAIADASHIGAAALVDGQAVTFLRAQHATLSDAGAFFSDPSGVSSPHSLYLVGASSIHQALATPTLELDAGANASAPMWAVELRAAHTRVVDECGDAVLEDLPGPLASALKLLPSKRSHVARAGCSAAGAEPASAMRSAADLQAIPHYSDFPLHSMRKSMLARFEDAGVEFTPSTWAVAYADHVARCSGGDSNHAAHEWAAHGLSDICHDVKSALGVGVEILTDPSVLVSLPKGSDGWPADVGLFKYGGIRGNTVAVDTTIAPILGVSTSDPTTALRAAERHKIQKERILFNQLDAASGMWTVAIPTARTAMTPHELREVAAGYFFLPSPCLAPAVGCQIILPSTEHNPVFVDLYGDALINLPAPGDAHWRVQHDAIADAFRDHCVHDLGIAVRREVDDLFQQAVPLGNTVPMDELKDLVPDAELSLPAFNVVTGSYDPRSLKSTLLEFKTMRYGVKYTPVPRATAVDRFERSLLGDIQRGLAARDAAWHNTKPGHKGPLRDILDMSEYTGMVFGTVGEVSKGVHRTVRGIACLAADRGALSSRGTRCITRAHQEALLARDFLGVLSLVAA
eukprot:jgi/Tetstr1/433159/TSEL_022491.t1